MDNELTDAADAEPLHERDHTPAGDTGLPLSWPDIAGLYEDYAEHLSNAIRKQFGDGPPDPEDVAQEAFYRLLDRSDLSRIKNVRAFVWRIARNIVLGEKHKTDVRSRYDFEVEHLFFALKGDVLTPEKIISARDQLAKIQKVFDEMPTKRRRALILHRIDGLTITDVGRQLGIGRTAAAKHIAKAAAQLNAAFLADQG